MATRNWTNRKCSAHHPMVKTKAARRAVKVAIVPNVPCLLRAHHAVAADLVVDPPIKSFFP